MDRLTTLVGFCAMYSSLATLNILINSPPDHLTGKKKWDYLGQHISFIHATTAVLMGLYVYWLEGGVKYSELTNFSHVLVLSHSLGYFFYDMIFAEIFGLHDWAMRTHHCCVLVGGTIMYMARTGGSIAVLCVIITEGSNPFMMLRKILKAKDMSSSQVFKAIELVFAGSFIFLRAVPCTFVNYNVWISDLSLVTKLAISITYAVGFIWMYAILVIALKQLPPEATWVKKASRGLGFISKNKQFFLAGVFIWALLVPFYFTQVQGSGFVNLKIGDFTVV